MSVLALDVVPGKKVGPFTLGMPIGEAIGWIQQKNKLISHAELKYNEAEPLATDIIVELNEDGLMLRFEPFTQKLKAIEVYDVPKLVLSYAGTEFSGGSGLGARTATLVSVNERFGPTHPGEFQPQRSLYYLHYPGLSFAFVIPRKYAALYSDRNAIPPMEFPDRQTPVANRIYVYAGTDMLKPAALPPAPNPLYFEEVQVQLDGSLHFMTRGTTLDFTSTTQDVLSMLGPPTRVFFKQQDLMKIHVGGTASPAQSQLHAPPQQHETVSATVSGSGDYFYNYCALGLDVLFEPRTHRAVKFVLHSNFPAHAEFNTYVKCNFRLLVPRPTPDAPDACDVINADLKWPAVQKLLAPVYGAAGKPVVHSKASPFGATLFYGFPHLIFETMKNGHLASLTLFAG
eukprot:TRINITY_DN741_c0_g1_i1.p1 TRINITY_DN741_c0_g1~~TRINITY_DN741_c0_g1_i1.p1  ORF type:complete len:400 (+),score=174.33 TRINITY_DN741_c0_g1_i1:154-1353(+)